jgi:hypothetical protein
MNPNSEEWTQRARPAANGERRSRRILITFTPTMATRLLHLAREDGYSVSYEVEHIVSAEWERRQKDKENG